MAPYLALQIIKGFLNYESVVIKFPQYKIAIDTILVAEGKEQLIQEVE